MISNVDVSWISIIHPGRFKYSGVWSSSIALNVRETKGGLFRMILPRVTCDLFRNGVRLVMIGPTPLCAIEKCWSTNIATNKRKYKH